MDKKKVFLSVLVILVLSTLLRLFNLNKPEGMWNDEYLTYETAHKELWLDFINAVVANCHAPLHYLYLKVWMHFFGESDYVLRLSSLVPGVLSVLVMFFAGCHATKKYSGEAGLVAALFAAINGFLIYFSQEVRIYSLLFLLSSISILFALKAIDNPSRKNVTFFLITSFLVMIEHTIGFVFVFFSSIGVILFASKKTKFQKYFISTLLILLILFIPIGIFLYNIMFHQTYFSQWWAPFSVSKLEFFFTDLLSPYLVNITNAPPEFMSMVYSSSRVNIGFVIFALIPLAIALMFAIRGVFEFTNKVKYFLLTFFGVYLTVVAASMFGKIVFLTKYMTEIVPILMLLVALGFTTVKNKNFKTITGAIYVAITLFFIFASAYSPVKLVRTEGQNIPPVMLNILGYNTNDKVLFLYYPKERFSKYSPLISDNSNTSHISKYDFVMIYDGVWSMEEAYKNGKRDYLHVFQSDKNQHLDDFLQENVYSKLVNGEKFYLVDFAPVSLFSDEEFKAVLNSKENYSRTPFLFLVFSYIRNYVVQKSFEKLDLTQVVENFDWRIYVFQKT